MGLDDSSSASIDWSVESDGAWERLESESLKIVQQSSGGVNWNSRNHVDRDGQIHCRLPGYTVQANGTQGEGKRAKPVALVQMSEVRIAFAIPEFWQQFPTTMEVDHHTFRAGHLPHEWNAPFELQGGERKTLTTCFSIQPGRHDEDFQWSADAPAVVAAPAWFKKCESAPFLPQEGADATTALDELLQLATQGEHSFFAKREVIDEYGWRNFGDVLGGS